MPRRPIGKKLLILALVAGVGYYAYTHFMPQGGEPGGGPIGGVPPVSVAEVIERKIQQWHEFSGRLVAVDQVEIRPRVSGNIESIHFKNGQQVKKGDLLFVIDPRPYEAAMQSAQARAMLAESELNRAKALLAEKAFSQRDYDQRKNAAEVARADLTRAKLDLDYTRIKSPIDGKVGRAEITVGNLVESGNAPVLTTVVSSSPIYADFEIGEDIYLQYAKTSDGSADSQIPVTMSLDGENGEPHQGRVESFDNRLDPATGTVRVRAIFDNEDGTLVPGLFARLHLGSGAEMPAVLITDRAVGTDQNKKFVLVVGEGNKVEYREVKLGPVAEGLRVVREGLKGGEKIVVSGLMRARPGTVVTPELVPMDVPDAAAVQPAAGDAAAAGEAKP